MANLFNRLNTYRFIILKIRRGNSVSYQDSSLNRCHFETRHFCKTCITKTKRNGNFGHNYQFGDRFFHNIKRGRILTLTRNPEFYKNSISHLTFSGNRSIHQLCYNNKVYLNSVKLKCLGIKNQSINQCDIRLVLQQRHISDISEKDINGNTVNAEYIEKVLKKLGEKNYEKGYTCYVTTCPKLGKKHLSMVDESQKLYINATTGHFICHHCDKSGPWIAFEDNIKALALKRLKKIAYNCLAKVPDVLNIGEEPAQVKDLYNHATPIQNLNKEEFETLTNEFDCVGLLKSVMNDYGVKLVKETNSLIFPFFSPDQKLLAIKKVTATVSEDENIKIRQNFIPRSGTWQLFGWNKVQNTSGSIVITSNETDALAVTQSTGRIVLSLPKGFTVLPQEVLPFLERFDRVIFWLGKDGRSWEAAKLFAAKVNEKRSYVIRPNNEDPSPLEALQSGTSLTKILDKARPFVHQSIVSFSQLKEEVFSELSMIEQVSGVKWKRYTSFNKLFKGHRRGELTVFTGPTGSGKTTFISEYSLDLCMQGVSTLWGSFEIQNVRLARVMLMQYALKNLHNHLDEFDYWSEKFDQLPMHFMTFFGQEDITKVIDVMSHAVYVHDIGHVIVDNLQFMMGMDFNVSDRFIKQDRIVAAFRRFATQKNCHVTLVIHPRKEKSDDDLTIASIFGTAKVTQEADNIMILQDKTLTAARGRKFIQIVKNRYCGERGLVPLKFHGDSLTFSGVAETKGTVKKEKDEKNTPEMKTKEITKENVGQETNEEIILETETEKINDG